MVKTKKITTINLPRLYLNAIKELVDLGIFQSRSQAIRNFLAEFLAKEKKFRDDLKAITHISSSKTIVTVNIDKEDLKAIAKLVGFMERDISTDHLYPSRSELFRVAVRDYLMKERVFNPDKIHNTSIEKNNAGEEIVRHKEKKWRILEPEMEYV